MRLVSCGSHSSPENFNARPAIQRAVFATRHIRSRFRRLGSSHSLYTNKMFAVHESTRKRHHPSRILIFACTLVAHVALARGYLTEVSLNTGLDRKYSSVIHSSWILKHLLDAASKSHQYRRALRSENFLARTIVQIIEHLAAAEAAASNATIVSAHGQPSGTVAEYSNDIVHKV